MSEANEYSEQMRAAFAEICPLEMAEFEIGLYNKKTDLRLSCKLKSGDAYSFFKRGHCMESPFVFETVRGWAVRVNERQASKGTAS